MKKFLIISGNTNTTRMDLETKKDWIPRMFADIAFICKFGKKKREDWNILNYNSLFADVVKIGILSIYS
jgi:hypothetical protein